MKALRPEEEWAREIISRTLSVPVEQHDDGSRDGMHDLWIARHDGPPAAVEVTAAADQESMKLWKLVNSGEPLIVPGLHGGWFVSLEPISTRAKWRAKQIPAFLGELEDAGEREVDVEEASLVVGGSAARARELGIASASQSGATDTPGSVYFTVDGPLERRGGFVPMTGDPIAAWVGDFLREERPDVVRKLGRSQATERHAFILVPGFTTAPFSVSVLLAQQRIALPVAAPQLPVEVTHVWVVGMWYGVEGCFWAPDSGWSSVRTLPTSSEAEPHSPRDS
jgi:hypothetical protein